MRNGGSGIWLRWWGQRRSSERGIRPGGWASPHELFPGTVVHAKRNNFIFPVVLMEKLHCKTCGCESLQPMQVTLDDEDAVDNLMGGEQESRFYSCQVCGDNWLSVKEKTPDGACTITFVHQMGTSPVLKRVAHMSNPVVISDESVDEWEYYKGDTPVEEAEWESVLSDRRDTLKATCMN